MGIECINVLQVIVLYFHWIFSNAKTTALINRTISARPGQTVKFPCPYADTGQIQGHWHYSPNLGDPRLPMALRRGRIQESLAYRDESILVFEHVTSNDGGYYTYIQPFHGHDTQDVCIYFLDILTPPIVKCDPSPVTVKESETVTLHCTAEGRPTPTLRWYRTAQDGIINEKIGITGTLLTLRNVTRHASGSYVCEAVNSMGNSECYVTLNVEFLPEMDVYEEEIALQQPRDVTLICRVTSNPMPFGVIWTKGDNHDKIRTNSRYTITEDMELLDTYYTKYLLLTLRSKVLGFDMFDKYWCRILGFGEKYTASVVVKDISKYTGKSKDAL